MSKRLTSFRLGSSAIGSLGLRMTSPIFVAIRKPSGTGSILRRLRGDWLNLRSVRGDWLNLRSLRSKLCLSPLLCLSPCPGRFSDRQLELERWLGGFRNLYFCTLFLWSEPSTRRGLKSSDFSRRAPFFRERFQSPVRHQVTAAAGRCGRPPSLKSTRTYGAEAAFGARRAESLQGVPCGYNRAGWGDRSTRRLSLASTLRCRAAPRITSELRRL